MSSTILALSAEDIVTKLLINKLPILTSELYYYNINNVIQSLYGNYDTLAITIGGGSNGLIVLIPRHNMNMNMVYTLYMNLPYPAIVYVIYSNGTAVDTTKLCYDQKEACFIFDNDINMYDILKDQIIDNSYNTYTIKLHHSYTGYLGVTTRDILNNLLDLYGKSQPRAYNN